jgi:HPt (histidine-containing phosphotransfer) domain-containing protein
VPENKKVINLDFLSNLADGNTDFILKMLEIYLKQTPENILDLDRYSMEKNYPELVTIAHKMRSSVPYVGLHEAEKLLEKIEYEAKQNINVENFPSMVERIIKLCEDSLVQVKEQLYLLSEKSPK